MSIHERISRCLCFHLTPMLLTLVVCLVMLLFVLALC